MKLQKLKNYYHVQMPKRIIEAMQWEKGSDLEVIIKGKDELLIKKKN